MKPRMIILFGLTMFLALVSACKPESRSPLAQQTNTTPVSTLPTTTVASMAPTMTMSATKQRPPVCQFNSTAPTATPQTTELYTFSGPQVVFTSTTKGVHSIYGWLPDNNQLMTNGYDGETDRFTIEVLNVQTGELHRYAERQADYWTGWLPQQQALAYIDSEHVNSTTGVVQRDLWISQGDPKRVERVASGIDDKALAIDTLGRLTFFSQARSDQPSTQQLERLDVTTRAKQALSFDLTQWELPNYSRSNESTNQQYRRFQSTWRPGTDSQVLFYFPDSGALLADIRTGQTCEIKIRRQDTQLVPVRAVWSPNGQYLATLVEDAMAERHLPNVLIINIETGQQFSPDLDSNTPFGAPIIDIEWGPDSQHLVALMRVSQSNAANDVIHKLYLIDAPTQTAQQMLPNAIIGGGAGGPGEMSWSPNGRHLAIKCPIWPRGQVITEERICLISTSKIP